MNLIHLLKLKGSRSRIFCTKFNEGIPKINF